MQLRHLAIVMMLMLAMLLALIVAAQRLMVEPRVLRAASVDTDGPIPASPPDTAHEALLDPVRAPAPPDLPTKEKSAAIAGCQEGTLGALPESALELPVSRRAELQHVLDSQMTVRLQAGDYRDPRLPEIHLRTGQRLFALPNEATTRLPRIVVVGGTTNAVLSGGHVDDLVFPPSTEVTSGNCFRRVKVSGYLTVDRGTLEDNLFLDIFGRINVDTSGGGSLKNNRFIRTRVHSTWPAIEMHGDSARTSAGNVFLWHNMMHEGPDGVIVDNQADWTLIGMDSEAFNGRGLGRSPLYRIGQMGVLRLFGLFGGQAVNVAPAALVPIFDLAADEVQIVNSALARGQDPKAILRTANQRLAMINSEAVSVEDTAQDAARFFAFLSGSSSLHATMAPARPSQLPPSAKEALQTMFVDAPPRVSWERPVFGPIADPAGPAWNQGLAEKPDSADYVQGLVDSRGVARLPAGVYYVSRPIRLRNRQGIIGAGQDRTALVALHRDQDLIVGDDRCQRCTVSITLADLTLQGGRNGIYHGPDGSGDFVGYGETFISHVTFRDMAEAGIFVDRILGWDNNFLDHLTFYRNAAGVKQRALRRPLRPRQSDEWSGEAYFDKNVFYHARFVSNGIGVDLQAERVDVFNAWVSSQFEDNGQAARLRNNLIPLFVHSDFVNNGGTPTIANDSDDPRIGLVGVYFRADARGAALLGDEVTCEGCVFDRGTSQYATVAARGTRGVFLNTRSELPIGPVEEALLVNSEFAANAVLNQQVVTVRRSLVQTVVPGRPRARPQLLTGSHFR